MGPVLANRRRRRDFACCSSLHNLECVQTAGGRISIVPGGRFSPGDNIWPGPLITTPPTCPIICPPGRLSSANRFAGVCISPCALRADVRHRCKWLWPRLPYDVDPTLYARHRQPAHTVRLTTSCYSRKERLSHISLLRGKEELVGGSRNWSAVAKK